MTRRLVFLYNSTGVVERWSIGVLQKKKSIFKSLLHHSITPKTLGIVRYCKGFAFFWVIDPNKFNTTPKREDGRA